MLRPSVIEDTLGKALSKGGEWAELFVEETVKHRGEFSRQVVKTVMREELSGAGLRVISDQREFYAHTNDLSSEGLRLLARELSTVVAAGGARVPMALRPISPSPLFSPKKDPAHIEWEAKVALLKKADRCAREASDKIVEVNADYLDEVSRVLIANSDGLLKEDTRTRARFKVMAIAAEGSEKEWGYEAPGAARGFEFFESLDIPMIATEAALTALRMLKAHYPPKGRMPVIIDSGFGGVLFHESCGHLLEASALAKKATVLADCLGKSIAASCVSAVDDGTIPSEWGSTSLDDEGAETKRNLLIENGVLRSYLVDRLNGERLGLSPTGSSRRESYRFSPTSRMNNTFILPGPDRLEAMIADTEYGLYAKKMGGGSVDPSTGEFNFAVMEGYVIRGGKIAEPVRGAVLIGRGEEILRKIDRVGNNLKLSAGLCGAASGWVPVTVGQPAIRVSDLLVGGRS